MQAGNPELIEIFIKSRMDIKEFEANIAQLERKMSVANKELENSANKIASIQAKNTSVLSKYAQGNLEAQKTIKIAAEHNLNTYKEQTIQLQKQIELTKTLSREAIKGDSARQSNKKTWDTADMQSYYSQLEKNTKSTGPMAWMQNLIGKHNELDDKMKQVNNTAKNTFPHKVSTTAQYMAAGAGIAGVVTALTSMASAIVESDKAMGMFESVLGLSRQKAEELQQTIFSVGRTYGGTVADLNETTLALGRAGISGDALVSSMKAVSQIALLTGEDLKTVTDVFISWKTIFPDAKMSELADSMVGVANASKMSISGLKTTSNYLLTAGSQAGLTSDALLAISGAWVQIGKSESTAGTEGRRFFEQITAGSDEVKKAYKALGINVDELTKRLAKGGPEAEQAMVDFFNVMHKTGNEEGQKVLKSIGATLDRATLQSILQMAKSGKTGVTIFEEMLRAAGDKANGMAEAQASRVSLTYEKMWERIKVSMTAGSTEFDKAFKDAFAGGDTTVEEFNKKLVEFDSTFSEFMGKLGTLSGNIGEVLAKSAEGYIKLFGLAHDAWNYLADGIMSSEAGIVQSLAGIGVAVTALTVLMMRNPVIGALTMLGSVALVIDDLMSKQKSTVANMATSAGMTGFSKDLQNIESRTSAISKETEARRILTITLANQKKWQDIINNPATSDAEQMRAGVEVAAYQKRIDAQRKYIEASARNRATLAAQEAKVKVLSDPTGLGIGSPELKGTDKSAEKAAREAERLAKEELKNRIALIGLDEQRYFKAHLITSEYEKQKYHTNTTLPLVTKTTEEYAKYKSLADDISKAKETQVKAENDLLKTSIELGNTSAITYYLTKLETDAAKDRTEADKVQTEYRKELIDISKKALDDQMKGSLDVLLVTQQIEVVESKRLAKLEEISRKQEATTAKILYDLDQQILGQQILTSQAKTNLDIEDDREEKLRDINKQIADGLILSGKEKEIISKINKIYDKRLENNTTYNRALNAGLDQLGNRMVSFFDYQSSGWLKMGDIAQDVLHTIYQEMMKLTVIDPFMSFLKGGGASSGAGSMMGLVSGMIGTTDAMGFTTTSGGTVMDAVGKITKEGTDNIGKLGDTVSTLSTVYSSLTSGLASSIGTASVNTGLAVESALVKMGFSQGTATSMGMGTAQFGQGLATPWASAGAGGAQGAGAMLGGAAIGAAGGYALGSIGDKLLGANTKAKSYGAIGGAIGSLAGPLGAVAGAVIGSLIGGAIGSTKVQQAGLHFAQVTGGDDASIALVQSWTEMRKKSWFSSSEWNEYGDLSSTQRNAIEGIFDTYDYLLVQLGKVDKLTIKAGNYTQAQFEERLAKGFISAFTGMSQTIKTTVNTLWGTFALEFGETNETFNAVYTAWVDYAKSIDKTVLQAITDSVNTFISSTRGFEVWSLGRSGKGTEALGKQAQWASEDLQNLADTMGVVGVTADNFTEKYKQALGENFSPDTISKWNALGTALMTAVDANDTFTKAVIENNAKLLEAALATVAKYNEVFSRIDTILHPENFQKLAEVAKLVSTATIDNADAVVSALQTARDAEINAITTETELKLDLLNKEKTTITNIANSLKTINELAKSIRNQAYANNITYAGSNYRETYNTIKDALSSGLDVSEYTSDFQTYANMYADNIKKDAQTTEEYLYRTSLLANEISDLGGTGTSIATLGDIESAITKLGEDLKTSTSTIDATFRQLLTTLDTKLAGQFALFIDSNEMYFGTGSILIAKLMEISSLLAGKYASGSTANTVGVTTGITQAYSDILGRTPDAEGATFWSSAVSSGVLTSANMNQAIASAAIPEIYQTLLGRAPDPAGLAYWSDALASGTLAPDQIDDAIRAAAIANGELKGYATGGYTGNYGLDQVAGIVHGQEYVVNAKTTKDLGLNSTSSVFQEMRDELKETKSLMVKLVADTTKQLQTLRAMYAQKYEEVA